MAWFKKKPDPISDRARALNAEIAALEQQIKRLGTEVQRDQPTKPAALRSTALPRGEVVNHSPQASPEPRKATADEPIFEEVDRNRLKSQSEPAATRDHFNELGVRKYDLPALLRRIRSHFRGPSTTNPKLVNYLAAGGIQGLRPMRYEKRVARNRLLVFVVFLFFILLGIIVVFVKQR